MTYPEVQFVAAPEEGADVLFDFNDDFGPAPAAIVAGSFTLGVPSIEGDPDGLGVQYGAREAGFTLFIYGNRYDAIATQALLARTFMLRRRGWLRVRLDALSSPVWLRTYTPTPGELDFSLIQPDSDVDAWRIDVTVAAEPFIRGERIELWSGSIVEDPAANVNPLGVVLPAVVGDAPAPLRIEAAFTSPRDEHDILLATSAVPAGYAPIVWPIGTGDSWTLGADTSAPVASGSFSGGSYRSVNFSATEDMSARIWGSMPAVEPGRYRVFLRASGADAFSFMFGYHRLGVNVFDGSSVVSMDYIGSYATMVNLGDFDLPLPSTDADLGTASAAPSVALAVQRLSGSSNLILDAFVLVPVDVASVTSLEPWEKCDTLVSSFGSRGPGGNVAGESQVWDGDAEATFRRQDGVSDGFVSAANHGRFPTVRPGVDNLLSLFQQTRAVTITPPPYPAVLDSSAAVSVSYQPRWLYLSDA